MLSSVFKNIIVLIPAYKPSETMYDLVVDLSKHFDNIVLVDDGSGAEYNNLFDKCVQINKGIILFRNVVNMGKGRAIKNGINYSFNLFNKEICNGDIIGFVTVDADGQHAVKDICNCCDVFENNTNKLILGSRYFGDNVPFRSKFGNVITSFVMKLFYGIKLRDTQTGLRVFSVENAKKYACLNGERYELEIMMIIESCRQKISVLEEGIETIYINDNSTSHFNPLVDSYKIYKVILGEFFKFSFSSLFSFLVDISFFSIFVKVFKNLSSYYVIIAAVLARIISSFVNFTINKNIVFENKGKLKDTILKYYSLVVIVLSVSSLSTHVLSKYFNGYEVPIKICVDLIIFFVDYRVQRVLFKNKTN